MPPNCANRTLWTGDNLDILRGMNSKCVDLIEHDESQTDDELTAEIAAAFDDPSQTVMLILNDLGPAVQALLAESRDPAPAATGT